MAQIVFENAIVLANPVRGTYPTPRLSFDDGDSGFYESADDQIALRIHNTETFVWTGSAFNCYADINIPTATKKLAFGDLDTYFIESSDDNLDLYVAGSQRLRLGSVGGIVVYSPAAYVNLSPAFLQAYTTNFVLQGASGTVGNGYHLTVQGGNAYSTGNGDGGNLYLFGGVPNGSGARGNIYFGNSGAGYLPARASENNVVYYDTATGKLSYGTAAGETYTNATAMPETVHGWEAGQTFSAKTMTQMWDGLLYPYQYPAVTAFALTGWVSILECGENFAGGSQTFTWTFSNASNVNTNTVAIRDVTNSSDLATGLANDGTEAITLTAGTQTTNGATRVWSIRATNSKAQTINGSYTVNKTTVFYSPIYNGASASGASVATLQGMTKRITGEVSFTFSYTTSNNKMYIAYPAAWGTLASVKDPNNFDITADFGSPSTLSFTTNSPNYKGATMNYYVYEFANNTTLTNFNVTFNF